MIKKSIYDKLRFQDELWLDSIGFAYGEDQLETYKIYKNGFKLGVLLNSGIINLDAKTDSNNYLRNKNRIYIRTKVFFVIWWRSIFKSQPSNFNRFLSGVSFFIKSLWTTIPICIFSLKSLSFNPLIQYIRGNIDGWNFVHFSQFKSLPPYVISKT